MINYYYIIIITASDQIQFISTYEMHGFY